MKYGEEITSAHHGNVNSMRGEEFQTPTQDITSTHDDVNSRRIEEFGETSKQDNVPFQDDCSPSY